MRVQDKANTVWSYRFLIYSFYIVRNPYIILAMGVKSLQTFLKNNEAYIADRICLHDTSLVIDGNNLLCQLYSSLALDKSSPHYRSDVYGGDLVHYGKIVKEFFDNLQKSNITPIIVFDGSVIGKAALREFVASKEKETHQRGLEKFKRAQTFSEYPDNDDLMLPQTINTVFRNVVTDMNVKRIQAAYEADTHIARIANEKDCPVLTNDSDFIIYQLKCGFILLDWFEHKTPVKDRTGKLGIKCALFSQRKLTKSLPGLKLECLPLMSVILGNDYVEAGTFDQVVATICNRHYDGFLEARSFNHRRIANLLTWLRRRTLDEAIDCILSMVHHNHKARLQKLLKMFMRNYNIEEINDFDLELDAIYSRDEQLTDKKELQPTGYLKQLMENDDLGSICLDMIFHNTHYNFTVVDDISLPSSSYVKFRPYSLALVLLRPQSYSNLTTYQRKLLTEKDSFNIYDRLNGEYAKLVIKPMEKLENFGSLEHLDCHTMILLEPVLKKNLLMNCFHFNQEEFNLMTDTVSKVFDGDYAKEVSICMILMKYIGMETEMAPKPQFVDALLLTLFFYASCAGQLNRTELPDASVYGHLLLKLRPHSIMANKIVYEPRDKDIFRRIAHFISQLQSAYKGYCVVNALLGHPFRQAKQGLFMNCVLIYRLTKLFRTTQEKLDDLCKDIPSFLDLCDSVKVLIHA